MEDDHIISEPELNNPNEEYDSEEELMPTALPVEGDPNAMDLEKVPENANEYLLQGNPICCFQITNHFASNT